MIALGRRVVVAADEVGLHPEGAAWFYDDATAEWRLYIVTSLVDFMGPHWVYKRLLPALPRLARELDVRSLDLYLASPKEKLIDFLRPLMATSRSAIANLSIQDSTMNGYGFSAHLYRMAPPLTDADIKRTRGEFERTTSELLAA